MESIEDLQEQAWIEYWLEGFCKSELFARAMKLRKWSAVSTFCSLSRCEMRAYSLTSDLFRWFFSHSGADESRVSQRKCKKQARKTFTLMCLPWFLCMFRLSRLVIWFILPLSSNFLAAFIINICVCSWISFPVWLPCQCISLTASTNNHGDDQYLRQHCRINELIQSTPSWSAWKTS